MRLIFVPVTVNTSIVSGSSAFSVALVEPADRLGAGAIDCAGSELKIAVEVAKSRQARSSMGCGVESW